MVHQPYARDFASSPSRVRRFTLASLALIQIAPIFVGGSVLGMVLGGAWSDGSPAVGRLLFSVMLVCSGAGGLIAIYRDWRYRQPFHRNPFFVIAIILVAAAQIVLVVTRQ